MVTTFCVVLSAALIVAVLRLRTSRALNAEYEDKLWEANLAYNREVRRANKMQCERDRALTAIAAIKVALANHKV